VEAVEKEAVADGAHQRGDVNARKIDPYTLRRDERALWVGRAPVLGMPLRGPVFVEVAEDGMRFEDFERRRFAIGLVTAFPVVASTRN
jgi:hypothetical protein